MDKHLRPVGSQQRIAHSMRALGRNNLPEQIDVGAKRYALLQTIKHDFFAVTGFYESADGERVVLKMGRTEDFAGVPLEWIGRWLCQREMRFYGKLQDLPNVPRLLGTVGATGFVHAYVPGRPLAKDKPIPDGFFQQLQDLLDILHARGIAYVDANKPENILLGDDGRPYLIDFQISWDMDGPLGRSALNRWWLGRLQNADIYHALKHKKRLRRDELTEEEATKAERRGLLIRIHRVVAKPYFLLRRRTFARWRKAGKLLPEGSK
jgi:predicted Ser/Thr protein kinase